SIIYNLVGNESHNKTSNTADESAVWSVSSTNNSPNFGSFESGILVQRRFLIAGECSRFSEHR
ncbi:hypothetical protein, partial [Vibrio fluvialis]|uniref:hypothetical protein n=1 Tax=Vibrio fluvialis TaxID=676 RepID=UPI001ABDD337